MHVSLPLKHEQWIIGISYMQKTDSITDMDKALTVFCKEEPIHLCVKFIFLLHYIFAYRSYLTTMLKYMPLEEHLCIKA